MLTQAAVLKREIEAQLADRVASALSPMAQQAPRLLPVGNRAIDRLLGGGFPLGSVCELTGLDGSGRSSLAISLLAAASLDAACAYVDVSDTFSPECAAAEGVTMANLLWVRFASAAKDRSHSAGRIQTPALTHADSTAHRPIHSGCGGSHPRSETKDLAPALEQMLFYKEERRRRKMEGTPGHPNQPLGLHTASKEQVDWERFNLRRVDEADPLRQMDRQAAIAARQHAEGQRTQKAQRTGTAKRWEGLDRALRATDQILQSGGFRVVVLDLATTDAHSAQRIPAATWFRFRRAAQESDAILLLLTKEPCARSSASCVLACSASEPPKLDGVLVSASRSAEIVRQRTAPVFGKKAPGRAVDWDASPAWMWAYEG